MPMIVDAALVTRKGRAAGFNTGSINAAGKTWPRERIHSDKGVFVAGRAEIAPFYGVACSSVKGIAESAVDLFNDGAAVLKEDTTDAADTITSFFKSFADFIRENADLSSSEFGMAVLAGKYDNIYVGISGSVAAFKYADGILSRVEPDYTKYDDGASAYGIASYSGVKPDDIFILLSDETLKNISSEELNTICSQSENNIQTILRKIASSVLMENHDAAVSLVAVKVIEVEQAQTGTDQMRFDIFETPDMDFESMSDDNTEDDNSPIHFVDSASGEAPVHIPDEADVPTDEGTGVQPEEEAQPENTADGKPAKNPKGKTVAFIIIAAVLAVMVLVLGIIAVNGINAFKDNGTLTTVAEESTTTVEESTTAADETTTEETTTKKEATTSSETTTRTKTVLTNETTTRRNTNNQTTTTTRRTETRTEARTEAHTAAHTEARTEAPTAAPTEAKTEAPTEAPTEAHTEAPTVADDVEEGED